MRTVDVPAEFQPVGHVTYPPHHHGFRCEEAVFAWMTKNGTQTDAVYLPIFWDTYLVAHGFGRDTERLQRYVDDVCEAHGGSTLWTVCEYADGISVDVRGRMHVFYCACDGGTPLPLLCDPHPTEDAKRTILASFVGVIDNYPIRRKMRDVCTGPEFVVKKSQGTAEFRRLMNSSKFALCPRGYGPTSYRLYEAIQTGCVPVYIYDTPVLPYADDLDWEEFCVLVPEDRVGDIPKILYKIGPERWDAMHKRCLEVYRSHFNMDSMCAWVSRYLETRWPL
jgi:hypothetical protein